MKTDYRECEREGANERLISISSLLSAGTALAICGLVSWNVLGVQRVDPLRLPEKDLVDIRPDRIGKMISTLGGAQGGQQQRHTRVRVEVTSQGEAAASRSQAASDYVLALQRGLKELGQYGGPLDGILNSRTKTAIADYQRASGRTPTGEPDSGLLEHILYRRQVAQAADTAFGASSASEVAVLSDVQLRLARLGYQPGPVDGTYGQQTRTAIMQFQKDRGLPVNGRLTNQLVAEINRLLAP